MLVEFNDSQHDVSNDLVDDICRSRFSSEGRHFCYSLDIVFHDNVSMYHSQYNALKSLVSFIVSRSQPFNHISLAFPAGQSSLVSSFLDLVINSGRELPARSLFLLNSDGPAEFEMCAEVAERLVAVFETSLALGSIHFFRKCTGTFLCHIPNLQNLLVNAALVSQDAMVKRTTAASRHSSH
jgi:hypothetical protein